MKFGTVSSLYTCTYTLIVTETNESIETQAINDMLQMQRKSSYNASACVDSSDDVINSRSHNTS